MKIPKDVRERVAKKLRRNGKISRSEIIKLLLLYGEVEDPILLQERDLNRTAQRLVAGCKDKKGNRNIYALKQINGEVEYAVIEKNENTSELSAAYSTLMARAVGMKAAAAKIKWRLLSMIWKSTGRRNQKNITSIGKKN